jgi:hypothetical protein
MVISKAFQASINEIDGHPGRLFETYHPADENGDTVSSIKGKWNDMNGMLQFKGWNAGKQKAFH